MSKCALLLTEPLGSQQEEKTRSSGAAECFYGEAFWVFGFVL